ncbi:hypothetical protein DFH09DRAFT_1261655, partial [Mycena vulgaris]
MSVLSTSDLRLQGLPPTSHASPVAYPSLARQMSTHQRTQGYVPGAWLPPAASAFVPDDAAGVGFAGVGARAALDAARAAAVSTSTA